MHVASLHVRALTIACASWRDSRRCRGSGAARRHARLRAAAHAGRPAEHPGLSGNRCPAGPTASRTSSSRPSISRTGAIRPAKARAASSIPPNGRIPYQPWAAAAGQEVPRRASRSAGAAVPRRRGALHRAGCAARDVSGRIRDIPATRVRGVHDGPEPPVSDHPARRPSAARQGHPALHGRFARRAGTTTRSSSPRATTPTRPGSTSSAPFIPKRCV